jgi:hypothetical protein
MTRHDVHSKPQQAFTTKPKHGRRKGHSPIRDRCFEFMQILESRGYTNAIPLDEAKRIFQTEIGIFDQKSVRAYFGSQASKSTRFVRQRVTYGTGTVSFKNIELTQDIRAKKGYLEILGMVSFELRGNTFFMKVLETPFLVPTLMKKCGVSKDRISLPIGFLSRGKGNGGNRFEKVSPEDAEATERETTYIHTLQGEREKLSLDFVAETVDENIPNMLANIRESATAGWPS